jgi:quercetin dioxygenase-like cupin family protein
MRVWIEGEVIEQAEGESVFVPGGAKHIDSGWVTAQGMSEK